VAVFFALFGWIEQGGRRAGEDAGVSKRLASLMAMGTRWLLASAVALLIFVECASATPGVTRIHLEGDALAGAVVSADGSIWVTSHAGLGVYRFDPATNRLVKWIPIGESQCLPAAAGDGRIWTSNCAGETGLATVYEIDAKTNRVVRRLKGLGVAFGGGSLWTVAPSRTALVRIDPHTGHVVARVKIPTGPVAPNGPVVAAACDGSVWLDADTSEIRIDTTTNTVVAVIPLPGAVSETTAESGPFFSAVSAACAGGKAWVPNLNGLYSIDEKTNTATQLAIPIKPNSHMGEQGLAASGDQVFVRTSDTTVTQVDSATGKAVHVYPAGGGGGGQIAIDHGSVWIPAFNNSALWRDRIASP
jgi:streptogramin lyase